MSFDPTNPVIGCSGYNSDSDSDGDASPPSLSPFLFRSLAVNSKTDSAAKFSFKMQINTAIGSVRDKKKCQELFERALSVIHSEDDSKVSADAIIASVIHPDQPSE